jgi:hypothetical protein
LNKKRLAFLVWGIWLSISCTFAQISDNEPFQSVQSDTFHLKKIRDIALPQGYERLVAKEGTYQAYIQNISIKKDTIIYLHNGQIKPDQSFGYLVLDIDVSKENLQQCADAAIRLRAEYLFQNKRFNDIHFNFSSGDTAYYTQWREGYRPMVSGNKVNWELKGQYDASYQGFRKYLEVVFNYAGSWSLDKELKMVENIADVQIGDMLVRGAFPGHVMLVVDIAQHTQTGEIIVLLAQSARPAQDIHIVKNKIDSTLSPWYSINALNSKLEIEEWTFYKNNLKRF